MGVEKVVQSQSKCFGVAAVRGIKSEMSDDEADDKTMKAKQNAAQYRAPEFAPEIAVYDIIIAVIFVWQKQADVVIDNT